MLPLSAFPALFPFPQQYGRDKEGHEKLFLTVWRFDGAKVYCQVWRSVHARARTHATALALTMKLTF